MAAGDATLVYSFPQWHPLSQQSPIPNGHRIQVNRKKHRRRRKKTYFCYSSHLGSKSACNTIIALSLFLILIVVIAIATMAIYIGMEIVLDGSLRVTYGDYYSTELYNRSSHFFLAKAQTYKTMIEKVFARSILGPSIKQCTVIGFKNGSLIVFYRLILDRRKIPSRTYATLEETAKKILFDEITTLKPAVFNNIRLDPKEIIIKKHTFHTEPANHADGTEPPTDEAVVANLSPPSVLRRSTLAPPILRRKPGPSITQPPPSVTIATTVRTKPSKKHRQPTIERTSKIKLQLDALRNSSHSTSPSPSLATKSVDVRKTQTFDVNGSANRYSFVSEDAEPTVSHSSGVSSQNTTNHGFGEAEVIIIPSTGDDNAVGSSTSTRPRINISPIVKATTERRENRIGQVTMARNSTATIQKVIPQAKRPESEFRSQEPSKPPISPVTSNPDLLNFTNVPTRSNIGLGKPLRPKPSLEKAKNPSHEKLGKPTTSEKPEKISLENVTPLVSQLTQNRTTQPPEEKVIKTDDFVEQPAVANLSSTTESTIEVDASQSTEANTVIVLNTEVVTSTSVQVSYRESNAKDEETADSTDDALNRDEAEITHNLPSMVDLTGGTGGSGQMKYKNIFPRSIRDVTRQEKATGGLTKGKYNTQEFVSIVEKYKKQPSNETLRMIIEHLASIYTKTTTQAIVSTKMPTMRPNLGGLLLTRPMHRISTSTTTTEAAEQQSKCELNSMKRCSNGQCIMEHLWCNQFADCSDGSDEKNCTCTDYLRAQFWHKKICDGIVDCWDFSDENQCEWCAPDKFVCANARLCVDQQKVCDGHRDCPSGDDEKNCLTISSSETTNKDMTYYSTGIITVKRAGIWGKLCYEKNGNESIELEMQKLNELGKAVCKIMTFKHFKDVKIISDAIDEARDNATYYRLTIVTKNSTSSFRRKNFKFVKTNCKNEKVIQVTCSGLECGMQSQIGISKVRGKYQGDRQSRIVGGGGATLGAWPWQAALYKEGEYQCGGTLITKKWLLSAGHCFNNALHDYWVARLGILRRSSTLPSPHEQIRPIRRIIVHPYYADAGFVNDISLLELNSEVQFTNFVRPICLPNPNRVLLDGTMCTVIGWGQLMESGGVYPDTLQEVQVPVISPAECHKRTILLPLYKITDGMLCAGFERGGRDACLGDSGGPLMCQNKGDAWHLYGVTSNGNGCARAHRPGVYTKVTNYLNWIDSYVKADAKNNVTKTTLRPASTHCSGHRCPLGECLPKARICNGYMECSDESDEKGC